MKASQASGESRMTVSFRTAGLGFMECCAAHELVARQAKPFRAAVEDGEIIATKSHRYGSLPVCSGGHGAFLRWNGHTSVQCSMTPDLRDETIPVHATSVQAMRKRRT